MQTIQRASHKALIQLLVAIRRASGMRQRDVARKLGRTQSWLAKIESGQRRIDVCELCDLARILKLSPDKVVAKIARIAKQVCTWASVFAVICRWSSATLSPPATDRSDDAICRAVSSCPSARSHSE